MKCVLLNSFLFKKIKRKEEKVRNFEKITSLYERLSRDNELEGENDSNKWIVDEKAAETVRKYLT